VQLTRVFLAPYSVARQYVYLLYAKDYAMPRLDIKALEQVMLRRNFLFKHQIANLVGISYGRLTEIIADHDSEVEEDIVSRLCSGLECRREEIVAVE